VETIRDVVKGVIATQMLMAFGKGPDEIRKRVEQTLTKTGFTVLYVHVNKNRVVAQVMMEVFVPFGFKTGV